MSTHEGVGGGLGNYPPLEEHSYTVGVQQSHTWKKIPLAEAVGADDFYNEEIQPIEEKPTPDLWGKDLSGF